MSLGHSRTSGNIAISGSQDGWVCVWDYERGTLLRTYILDSSPSVLILDPLDLGFYTGFENGLIQHVQFHEDIVSEDTLRQQSERHDLVQPDPSTLWRDPGQTLGAVLSLALGWDTTLLLSGHASGKIAIWSVANGNFESVLTALPGPVTNLLLLPPTGLPSAQEPPVRIHTVQKPKVEINAFDEGKVQGNYSITVQLAGRLPSSSKQGSSWDGKHKTEFQQALTHPSFPQHMLDDGIAELASWGQESSRNRVDDDFMALDEPSDMNNDNPSAALEQQNEELRKQIASMQRIQKVTFKQLQELREQKNITRKSGDGGLYDSE